MACILTVAPVYCKPEARKGSHDGSRTTDQAFNARHNFSAEAPPGYRE
jgi:hypothetical protein